MRRSETFSFLCSCDAMQDEGLYGQQKKDEKGYTEFFRKTHGCSPLSIRMNKFFTLYFIGNEAGIGRIHGFIK